MTCLGVGALTIARFFVSVEQIPSPKTTCPKYSSQGNMNTHFASFSRNPACWGEPILLPASVDVRNVPSSVSIVLWKIAGAAATPNGRRLYLNSPFRLYLNSPFRVLVGTKFFNLSSSSS